MTDKKVMISQPMAGKTPEEILKVRDKAVKYLEGLGYEVLDTYFPNDFNSLPMDILNKPLFFLGQSLMYMSYCDVVYFCTILKRKVKNMVKECPMLGDSIYD